MTVTEIARMFAGVPHVWEGLGVHEYLPPADNGCAVCEALDAILVGREHDDEQRTMQKFWEEGLVFLCNAAVLHPRGYALTVSVDENKQVTRMFVQGDGDEPWVFDVGAVDESLTQMLTADLGRENRWQSRR